jgi:hypothetical protein
MACHLQILNVRLDTMFLAIHNKCFSDIFKFGDSISKDLGCVKTITNLRKRDIDYVVHKMIYAKFLVCRGLFEAAKQQVQQAKLCLATPALIVKARLQDISNGDLDMHLGTLGLLNADVLGVIASKI